MKLELKFIMMLFDYLLVLPLTGSRARGEKGSLAGVSQIFLTIKFNYD
jgi:hypothetical protein